MFHSIRDLRRAFALAVGTVVLAAVGVFALAIQPAWAAATGGSGASLPYVEVQAENSATNGTVIGPSYTQGQLADEASYRKAVTLQGTGKYVTFTTPVATNSIDFRYSIPDGSGGSVYTAPLSLYINGTKQTDFTADRRVQLVLRQLPVHQHAGQQPAPLLRRGAPAVPARPTRPAPRSRCRSTRRTPPPRTRSTSPTSSRSARRCRSRPARSRSPARAPTRPASNDSTARVQRGDQRGRCRRHGVDPAGHLQHPGPHQRSTT